VTSHIPCAVTRVIVGPDPGSAGARNRWQPTARNRVPAGDTPGTGAAMRSLTRSWTSGRTGAPGSG